MWRQINPLLVGFGQERCRAIGPACDGCGIRALCPSAAAAEGASDGGGDNEYLAVPYADKDEAKALGARWDPARRQWYAPPLLGDAAAASLRVRWGGAGATTTTALYSDARDEARGSRRAC